MNQIPVHTPEYLLLSQLSSILTPTYSLLLRSDNLFILLFLFNGYIHTLGRARKSYWTGFLFTHKAGNFGTTAKVNKQKRGMQEPIKTEVDIQELKLGFTEPNPSSRPNTKVRCSMCMKRQAIRFSVNIASRLAWCTCASLQKSPEISLNRMIWVKAYTKSYSV